MCCSLAHTYVTTCISKCVMFYVITILTERSGVFRSPRVQKWRYIRYLYITCACCADVTTESIVHQVSAKSAKKDETVLHFQEFGQSAADIDRRITRDILITLRPRWCRYIVCPLLNLVLLCTSATTNAPTLTQTQQEARKRWYYSHIMISLQSRVLTYREEHELRCVFVSLLASITMVVDSRTG